MAQVLVCGSAAVDMVFEVDAFPERAEKYAAQEARIVGGGCAANAAVAIRRLGGQARLVARFGQDMIGDMTLAELEREGVDLSLVDRRAGGRSAYSSILIDASGERQIVAFRGRELAQTVDRATLGRPDAVLADTRWPEAAEVVLAHAREIGRPGVLDAEAPVPARLVELASHVAFSVQGLREFSGIGGLEEGLRLAAGGTDAWLAVTDGARGVLMADGRGGFARVPAPEVAVVDTLGAGDIWHGAFALRLSEGAAEAEAVAFANAAAALKCTRAGGRSGTPSREETERFMQGDDR